MVIHKTLSEEYKGDQQTRMVYDCMNYWCWLNNKSNSDYANIMNMETYKINYVNYCYIATLYRFNPNKW